MQYNVYNVCETISNVQNSFVSKYLLWKNKANFFQVSRKKCQYLQMFEVLFIGEVYLYFID